MFHRAVICTLERVQDPPERHFERSSAEVARATVAVLCGGRSSERAVSLVSGAAVLAALRERAGASDFRGPARCVGIEIEPSGAWSVEGERCAPASAIASLPGDALFFVGLHGGEGENGAVQGLLETCSRRFTGSGVGASALCMDKHATRLVLADAGLTVSPARVVDAPRWNGGRAEVLRDLAALSPDGWAVKPNCGGSSVATSLVLRAEDLPRAVERALATGDRALVERRIRGIEATCAVLGNAGGELRALTPVEIVPHAGRFFDWEEKYSARGAAEHCPPENLSTGICAHLRDLAIRAHRAAGCDGYSRTDFIVPEGPAGAREPVLLEINTLPGLTPRSLLPKSAATDGLAFRDLCLEILALAVERQARRSSEAAA
jgi:D-alanine-D-alanine ligase